LDICFEMKETIWQGKDIRMTIEWFGESMGIPTLGIHLYYTLCFEESTFVIRTLVNSTWSHLADSSFIF